MSLTVLGSFPLGAINIAASAGVSFLAPVLSELDASLFGAFGLGGLEADVSSELNGALQAQIQIGLSINNPIADLQATLAGIASLSASISTALSIPALPSAQLSAQVSASAAVSAALAVKLGGIQALISAAIAVKSPAADFLADLTGNLSAGPVVLASWGYASAPTSLAATGADIDAAFSTGIGGLLPSDSVYGVLLVTKDLSASVALAATLKVI